MTLSSFTSRIFALILAVFLAFSFTVDAEAKTKKRSVRKQTVSRSAGTNDPRYAALIMNPVTGEIYHQQNPDGQRYPASLTKMMTLYLLFDALDKGKVDMNTRMEASDLAARMPRTNLSLQSGDSIDVETAIKALIVLSANDVAVVVAEHLGGDVDHFAEMMTAKAKALGMKNTVYQNPNGLPNSEQHTTARDQAKLGIALKRDFPKYYKYFSTLQFSHNGVTYYTHNRVMLRYAGVDGIKTGFVNASGFNLVTSVTRGGRPLVGVVLGGSTGRWRDNRMIELLDQSYRTISSRGAVRGKMYPENLPMTTGPARKAAGIAGDMVAETVAAVNENAIPETEEADESGAVTEALPPASIPEDRAEVRKETAATSTSPFAVAESKAKVIKVEPPAAPQQPAPVKSVAVDAVQKAPKATVALTAAPPAVAPAPADDEPGFEWGIQVGAFSSTALANQAIAQAQQIAARQLVGAKPAISSSGGNTVYRARIVHISQTQARNACQALIAQHTPCFTFNAGQ